MISKGFHPFHLVIESPWPITTSSLLFSLIICTYSCVNGYSDAWLIVLFTFGNMTVCAFMWWNDVISESTYQGHHTFQVQKGLYLGFLLFILSEVMFFFSFFFSYFFTSLSPDISLGCNWPPLGVSSLDYNSFPLLNTLLLLSSGVTVTWSHHSIIFGNKSVAEYSLLLTISLGVVFTLIQSVEYYESSFTISDSVYGSLFYIITGFHGIHVLVGTCFLIHCFSRLVKGHFSQSHHLEFEISAWYWHFVDIVWLFLFITVYWWGS